MQAVAKEFDRFYRKAGRLPEEGNERETYQRQLSTVAGKNAYNAYDASSPQSTDLVPNGTVVRIQIDMALSALQIPEYETKASRWCKLAQPGTITIIHNTENFYLIWGAGVDGQPISTEDRKKPFLISRDLGDVN
jgi:hypothetical protein